MSESSSIMDDAFELLSEATELEKVSRIEAATKYFEAIYLMKRFLQKIPQTSSEQATRLLVQEKITHYENIARGLKLAASDGPCSDDPRAPVVEAGTFIQDVVPLPPPPPPVSSFHPMAPVSPRSNRSNQQQAQQTTRIVGQANQKLAQALDLDETNTNATSNTQATIDLYMEAARLYLDALQLAESGGEEMGTVKDMLKRRLESTLDRVEQLKQPQKTRIPSQRQSDSSQQQQTKGMASASSTVSPAAVVPQTSSPASTLTAKEIEILKRSSLIASGVFLPWSDQDAVDLLTEARQSRASTPLYTDPAGFLPLCDNQKKHFYKWARPSEIVQVRHKTGRSSRLQKPVMVHALTPYTIKQQYVTDCSFIASLCICAAFERRFRKRLVTSVLYPQTASGELVYNPDGKYMVKLWLNGVARCVTIDDYLPIDKYGNLLCSHSSSPTNSSYLELYVCLLEKGFLKLAGGGYGFPGSNSGVDLFSLTGWIPESVLFAKDPSNVADYETHPERAWERVSSACSYGDCLITVSSSSGMSEKDADAIGIVTGHAYAVLSVIETKNGTRLLQLKNPWAHKGWKGRFSSRDAANWRDPKFRAEVGYNPEEAIKHDDGVFWICWQDVLKYFENFHLSWNPALFSHRTTVHEWWPKEQGPTTDTYNMGENPQYTLEMSDRAITRNASIWILLSRHVTKQEQLEGKVEDYLAVHIHKNTEKKERVWYPGRSGKTGNVLTGAYTNSPQILVRYDVNSKDDKYLTLVVSQYEKTRDLSMTLSIYATEHFVLSHPPKDLEHTIEISSAWTEKTAGGPYNSKNPAFGTNPTFAIHVPEKGATVELQLSTSKTAAINGVIAPVSKFGHGVDQLTGPVVVDTGKYRHGFSVTQRQRLKAGSYVLVISNYHRGQKAAFKFKLCSSAKVKLREIT